MLTRRQVLLKRFEQVSDDLSREEMRLTELSKLLSDRIDKVQYAEGDESHKT